MLHTQNSPWINLRKGVKVFGGLIKISHPFITFMDTWQLLRWNVFAWLSFREVMLSISQCTLNVDISAIIFVLLFILLKHMLQWWSHFDAIKTYSSPLLFRHPFPSFHCGLASLHMSNTCHIPFGAFLEIPVVFKILQYITVLSFTSGEGIIWSVPGHIPDQSTNRQTLSSHLSPQSILSLFTPTIRDVHLWSDHTWPISEQSAPSLWCNSVFYSTKKKTKLWVYFQMWEQISSHHNLISWKWVQTFADYHLCTNLNSLFSLCQMCGLFLTDYWNCLKILKLW